MSTFLHTLCEVCDVCSNLITLEPGPDQCDDCLKAEQEQIRKQDEEAKTAASVKRPAAVDTVESGNAAKMFKASTTNNRGISASQITFSYRNSNFWPQSITQPIHRTITKSKRVKIRCRKYRVDRPVNGASKRSFNTSQPPIQHSMFMQNYSVIM